MSAKGIPEHPPHPGAATSPVASGSGVGIAPAATPAPANEWTPGGHEALMRIPVAVEIVLGTTRMPFAKLMGLTRGSIVPLDRKVGDLVDIVVNDRLVARGEVVVLDDEAERFAVAVREVVRPSEG